MLSRAPTEFSSTSEILDGEIFQIQSILSDLDSADPRRDLPVLESTYEDIQTATTHDSELQTLKH